VFLSSLGRPKFQVSFVVQFVKVCCSFVWCMCSSFVFFMCRGGWRFLVRMSLVFS
jgi:hypothetical protein